MNKNFSQTDLTAVVLLNLGGPDSLESVEPFLYNLFCDPFIIDLPLGFLFRKPLARRISSKRRKEAQHIYQQIGGKSPLLELTQQQALALESRLAGNEFGQYKVFIAMRYWHPFTEAAMQQVRASGATSVVLLPLYPQYSRTTSTSSLAEWKRLAPKYGVDKIPTRIIPSYHNEANYIAAVAENLQRCLKENWQPHEPQPHILFSAHGVPVSVIERGDPYQAHIEETVRLVMEAIRHSHPHIVCYQSKVGKAEWLKPSTEDTIKKLGAEGVKDMLVVPIAFVSDHSETLYELDMLLKDVALAAGVKKYVRVPSLNSSPRFINTLAELVRKKTQKHEDELSLFPRLTWQEMAVR
jgi:ferrochelatase